MGRVCKVLIVEDDEYVRQVLGDAFADEGYHFMIVRDGVEMRQALAETPAIDIVVIDVALPGKDNGLALGREVASRGLGVILVSGDHSRYEQMEKSGHRFLFKPFRMHSLLALVDDVLNAVKRDCERPKRPPAAPPAPPV
jgi:DNA-binding NtrC family response regulator